MTRRNRGGLIRRNVTGSQERYEAQYQAVVEQIKLGIKEEEMAQTDTRIERLERIIRDTLWMARRYADGRQTYAVAMYNNAAREARELGLIADSVGGDSIFAIDGTGRADASGLSEAELTEARGDFKPAG